jgi:hypothetical protein
MRAIYSVRIFCDGNSIGKSDNQSIGFYADDAVQTNPPVILWCTSKLAPTTDATTVIDGYLARSYAPIIEGVSDIIQSFDVDSPVVNRSGVTLTLANHDKALLYMQSQGVSLIGLPLRITLNQFNESGALIGGAVMFSGTIVDMQFTDTEFTLACENTKYARNSNILKPGEQFTAGSSSDTDTSYFKTKRDDNFKTIYNNDGQNSFLLIGGFDTINSTVRKRTYHIFFKTSFAQGLNLAGWWMYVEQSGTESRGEYRRIVSSTEINIIGVNTSIAAASIGSGYLGMYNNGWYLEIEIEGAFTEGLIVDLCTYVQFIHFDHKYTLSKNPLSGTVDRLYSKIDDSVIPFGTYGYSCTLNTDGTIDLTPDYPIDDDTIITYTGMPCTDLALIGSNSSGVQNERSLREWVYELGDVTNPDPFKNLQVQSCTDNNGGFVAGFFGNRSATVNIVTLDFQDYGGAFDRRVYWPYNATFNNTYTTIGNPLVGIQFELPVIPDNFKFKSVHLGLAIRSNCNRGAASPGITCITKQAYGTAKKHFNAPLVHTSGPAYINTIPGFYTLPVQTFDNNFYPTDWQWKTPDTAPQTRFTCLESTKLQDVDTVEKYRKILKVGLFFPRESGTNVVDEIRLLEIAAIFKHENSLTEVLV